MHQELEKLNPWLDRLFALNSALVLCEWDAETEAPEEAGEMNAKVTEYLSGEYYNTMTDKELAELIDRLSKETELSAKDAAIVKELRKQFEDMEPIPASEYQAYKGLTAKAPAIWAKAKKNNNYEDFAPVLKEIIEYQKKFANYRIQAYKLNTTPYDLLLNDYEEGFTTKELDAFFAKLKDEIVPLLQMVVAKKDKIDKTHSHLSYPVDKQRVFNRMLAEHVGFDFKRGVIKESVHPFTTNFHNRDVRMTTHYYENNFESAIFSTIHESGHALYEMHIDDAINGTPVGTGVSMGMHESQSRLFENNFGRSREFWIPLYDKLKETYPENLAGVSLDHFILGINKSTPSLIRTEADELTYCLHIMVRYEVEKLIFAGEVSMEELPEIWNQKYEEYLGIRPETDSEGILQDIHWAGGSFGYFPSYALGTAIAAQIQAHMKKVMPLDQYLMEGNFEPINAYLTEHIHRFGKIKTTKDILQDMMQEEFNPQYYIDYLKEKYETLYANL